MGPKFWSPYLPLRDRLGGGRRYVCLDQSQSVEEARPAPIIAMVDKVLCATFPCPRTNSAQHPNSEPPIQTHDIPYTK